MPRNGQFTLCCHHDIHENTNDIYFFFQFKPLYSESITFLHLVDELMHMIFNRGMDSYITKITEWHRAVVIVVFIPSIEMRGIINTLYSEADFHL